MADSKKLPDKLSALLRLAVADCRKVEKMKTRTLDMGVWFATNGVCRVCMAGAVLDRTLRFKPTQDLRFYGDLAKCAPEHWKLAAIDNLRTGLLESAFQSLRQEGYPPPRKLCQKYFREIGAYANTPARRAPWSVYLKQADILEKAGY